MIEVKNLTKQYGSKKAVDNLSFTVKDGEILGFLGPNGAGKSTTMNILTGYISCTDGQALINGIDVSQEPIKAKGQIGYLPEHPPLYLDMTVKDYLNFVYDLKKVNVDGKTRLEHIEEICGLVKIADVYGRIIRNLSKGYRQRVGIAQALLGNPSILILDEPTVGLDPKQIIEIRTLIKKLSTKHTVILSSHILSEIQAVCDRIIIINKGQIVADDTADNLTRKVADDSKLIARIEGNKDEILKIIKKIPNVVSVTAGHHECEKGAYDYEIETGGDVRRELFKRIVERKWIILGLRTTDLTLEDIFLKIITGEKVNMGKSKSDNLTENTTEETQENTETQKQEERGDE